MDRPGKQLAAADYPIGTIINHEGALLEIREDASATCDGCHFQFKSYDCGMMSACIDKNREDNKSIIFKKIN